MAITVSIFIKVYACGQSITAKKDIHLGDSFLYKPNDERFITIMQRRFLYEQCLIKQTIKNSLPNGFRTNGGSPVTNRVYLPYFVLEKNAVTFEFEIHNENSFCGTYRNALQCAKKALKTAGYVIQ